MENVVQLPVFTSSEDIGEVLRDVARQSALFDKLVIITQGEGLPMIWSRGANELEAIGMAQQAVTLLTARAIERQSGGDGSGEGI